jgi:hypothetical protein
MLVIRNLVLTSAMALAFTWSSQNATAQGAFTITSSSFKDGERLPTKMAGNNKQNPNCVGDNVSPALSWSNPPAGTKSYALIMYDPEGRGGLGVVHWVAYGIPTSVTGFAEGETGQQDREVCRWQEHDEPDALFRSLHTRGRPAPLYVHADRHRPRTDGVAAWHDSGRSDEGTGWPCQRRDRNHRHVLQAVNRPSRHLGFEA